MSTDLADFLDGTPGRFVPAEMRGQLVEAEHLARYWWAAGLAPGKRVLDAGCGLAYGSTILARAGATSVAAVDIAEAVIAVVQTAVPENVTAQVADVRDLPFESDRFDLVVCFEVIEHVDEQDEVIAELARVLVPGGLLAISSPNRDAYVSGNPHHRHEYTPQEFATALKRQLPHVRMLRQDNFVACTILDDDTASSDAGALLDAVTVRKVFERSPGSETYTVALASDEPLTEAGSELLTIADPIEVRQWLERFDAQQREFDERGAALEASRRDPGDRPDLLARLAEAESANAAMTSLIERAEVSDALLAERDELRERLDRADRVLSDVFGSPSWKVTRPLRTAKHAMERLRR